MPSFDRHIPWQRRHALTANPEQPMPLPIYNFKWIALAPYDC
jgi:hypothetical protein